MGLKKSLRLERWLDLLDVVCLLACWLTLDCTFLLSFFALSVIPQRLPFFPSSLVATVHLLLGTDR
jgi:hypothetical protein